MTGTECRFEAALALAHASVQEQNKNSIGVQKERLLHAFLKYYLEPDAAFHEQPTAGFSSHKANISPQEGGTDPGLASGRPFIADVQRDGAIIEVQTRDLYRLKRKLEAFLAQPEITQVNVVFPIATTKWLVWVEEDGTCRPRRKSPKPGTPMQILPELYGLRALLQSEKLTFTAAMVQLEEYRHLNGWSRDKKRGSHRMERVPLALDAMVALRGTADYRRLVPDNLPAQFTVQEFGKQCRMQQKAAWRSLHVLTVVGVVQKCGKRGRSDLYEMPDGAMEQGC